MEIIMKANPELTKLVQDRKMIQNKVDYNLCGSVCSYFLQTKECDILEAIFIHCKQKGLIINDSCVLCADGLMIESVKYYDNLLNNEVKFCLDRKTLYGFFLFYRPLQKNNNLLCLS